MANGTQTEEVSLLDQIDAAREDIAAATQAEVDAQSEYDQLQEQVAEAQRKMEEATALKREAFSKMRSLVEMDDAAELEAEPAAAAPAPARAAAAPARPAAAPARTGNVQPKAAVAAKPPARPAAKPAARVVARTPAAPARPAATAAPKPAPAAAKPAPDGRLYGQETSLRKEIWNVLDRDPETYKQHIADYPEGAVGLKVSEIRVIIEKEGKWQSSSTNISPQIQQHLYGFRDAGKVDRDDANKRYYIVEGAKFDDAAQPAEQPAQ